MNVLITNFHPAGGGGHTTYILALAGSLPQYGINPVVACPGTSRLYRTLLDMGVKVYAQDFPNNLKEFSRLVGAVATVKDIVEKDHIDAVHVNGSPDHWITAYYKIIFRSRMPVIRTRHGMQRVRESWSTRFLHGLTSATIAVCRAQRELYIKNPGFSGQDVYVVPNGVDREYYKPRPKDADVCERYGIKEGDFVFGSTAGIARHKGVEAFLRAAAPVIKKDPGVKIMLMGDPGDFFTGLADRLGIGQNVIFPGFYPDVRPYVSVFDFGFVFSNAVETISFAAREMMMMGKPMVVSDFGGLPENVTEGVDGFVVEGGSEERLSAILSKITADRTLAAGMGQKARLKASREFGREDFLEKTAEVYRGVV